MATYLAVLIKKFWRSAHKVRKRDQEQLGKLHCCYWFGCIYLFVLIFCVFMACCEDNTLAALLFCTSAIGRLGGPSPKAISSVNDDKPFTLPTVVLYLSTHTITISLRTSPHWNTSQTRAVPDEQRVWAPIMSDVLLIIIVSSIRNSVQSSVL